MSTDTKVWTLYALATGMLGSCTLECKESELVLPEGVGAVEGAYDWHHQKVDLETGEVVEYIPPAPEGDALTQYVWDVGLRTWLPELTLEGAKAKRWGEIKQQRDAIEGSGFTWDGSVFDSDLTSQSRIQGAVQLAVLAAGAGQPFSIEWTLADNSVRTLNGTDMINVGFALAAHVESVFTIGRALREDILAATTVPEVGAVQWPL